MTPMRCVCTADLQINSERIGLKIVDAIALLSQSSFIWTTDFKSRYQQESSALGPLCWRNYAGSSPSGTIVHQCCSLIASK